MDHAVYEYIVLFPKNDKTRGEEILYLAFHRF